MLELFVLGVALYLAWSSGSHDIANSMGTVYGSRALSLGRALFVGALFQFLGAALFGDNIAKAISSGIIDMHVTPVIVLSIALWLTIAAFRGYPISITHATVGSIIGYGMASSLAINWVNFSKYALGWIAGPLLGAVLSLFALIFAERLVMRLARGLEQHEKISKRLITLQIAAGSILAFSQGANDVGVIMGVVGGDITTLKVLGGLFMALGILTFGKKIIRTVGDSITFLTPLSGLIVQAVSSTLIMLAVLISLPVSATHIVLGSLIGVGMASKINWSTLWKVLGYSFLTIPVTAAISMALYFLF